MRHIRILLLVSSQSCASPEFRRSIFPAGCYLSLKTSVGRKRAREEMDRLPALLERKKIAGRDLPTEVFIRKKREPAPSLKQIGRLLRPLPQTPMC